MSDGWFLIAEFAGRSRLPVSALRYYDRVGLLRPAPVDPAGGYRRHRAEQLDDAVTIARLDGEPPAGTARLRLPGGEFLGVEHHGARDTLAQAHGVLLDAADRAGTPALGPVVEWYPSTPGPVTTTSRSGRWARPEISRRTRRG